MKTSFVAIFITLSLLATRVNAETPAATQAIIDDQQLRAADQPISSHPDWRPQRVAVTLPSYIATVLPEYEGQLKSAAEV